MISLVKKSNIFIFGGNSLASKYCQNKNYNFYFYKRKISKSKKIILTKIYAENIIKKTNPFVIINLMANTDVNFCEKNKKKSLLDNFLTNKIVTDICKKNNIPLVYFSTDQLFDGKSKFYTEKSRTKPLNNYSKHKLKSEKYITKNLKKYLIIRTNFFANNSKSSLINFIKKNKTIKGYVDVIFNPLHIINVWKIVYFLIENKYYGIFNLCADDTLSKYKFIKKVSKKLSLNNQITKSKLLNEKSYKKIKRPLNMTLSNKKIKKLYKNSGIYMIRNNLKIL